MLIQKLKNAKNTTYILNILRQFSNSYMLTRHMYSL